MKVGILGGTFDPVHKGHLALAAAAQNQFGLDKIVFIPANIPPHKSSRRNMASPQDRYKMVALSIQSNPSWEASSIEIDRTGVSYTADTVKMLQTIYPAAQLFLILGADAFADFDSWHDAASIRSRVAFLVAGRPGVNDFKSSSDKVFRVMMPDYPVASTDIRAKIRDPKFSGNALPESVLEYIQQHNLYK